MTTDTTIRPVIQRGGPSITLRFRKGTDLLAWYRAHATRQGVCLTEALLTGLAYYRAAQNGGHLITHQEESSV